MKKVSLARYTRAKRGARQAEVAQWQISEDEQLLKTCLVRLENALKYIPMTSNYDREADILDRTITQLKERLNIQ